MVFERLQQALSFWWKHFLPLLMIVLPFAVIGSLVEIIIGPMFELNENGLQQVSGLSIVLVLLVQVVAEGALICQLAACTQGKPRNLLDCTLFALYLFAPLAITMVLTVMPLAASAVGIAALAGIGAASLAFIVVMPGLWGYLRLATATFSAVLDRETPMQALRTSIARTRAIQWPLLIAWMLSMLIILMLASVISASLLGVLGEHGGSLILLGIVQKMLGAILTVLLFLAWQGKQPDITP